MRRIAMMCGCVAVLAVVGCGASSPDALAREQIQLLNDQAAALESGAPESKAKDLQERITSINKRMEALNLSAEEKQKLMERHKEELTKAIQRLQKAVLSKAMKGFGEGFPGMPNLGGAKQP